MEKVQISAVVITYNEEKHIAQCLDSLLKVSDEIVVVDSFSNDATKSICESYQVKFIEHTFQGYVEQKNFAAEQTQFDYILSLDADEALSSQLQQSILEVKNQWRGVGYSFKRLNKMSGKWIRFGNWTPDIKLRLWKKGTGKFGGLNPHDKFEFFDHQNQPTLLNGYLLHFTYSSVTALRKKNALFAEIAAAAFFQKGIRANWWNVYLSGPFRFIRGYFFKLGFLDGRLGWIIAYESMKQVHLKYKLLRAKWNMH